MMTVQRALNSIGKKCFIDYYDDFKNCHDKDSLARKLLRDNPSAISLPAQITRINCALWIFENAKEIQALEIVINSSRLDNVTVNKARNIYTKSNLELV